MTSWLRVLIYRRLAAISVFRGCELAVPVSCSLLLSKYLAWVLQPLAIGVSLSWLVSLGHLQAIAGLS